MSLLGIDVGTTGCKAILFSESGQILGTGYREYALRHPQPGWAELDPQEVWDSVRQSVRTAVAQAGPEDPVRAISTSSQGEAAVPLGKNGEILGPGIVSFDGRTAPEREAWAKAFGAERLFQITGMPLHTMYTLLKLQWLRSHQPEIYQKAWKFLCFGDFTLHQLGGPPVIDYSMAARTMAFDLHALNWSQAVLDAAGIDADKLPEPLPSGTDVGKIHSDVAADLGLPAEVRLVTGAHDQLAGALGAGITRSGIAMDATGTVECICPAFSEPVLTPAMRENNYCCYPHAVPGLYVTIAFNFTGGALLRWYRDEFGRAEVEEARLAGLDVYDVLMAKAGTQPSGVFVLPHFTVSGTPWFDSEARGAILGLTLGTTKTEIIQGILDGITFEMRLNLEKLEEAGVSIRELRAIGGGAKSRTLLQIKANVFNRPVHTLNISEAACLGAAMLAGKALGAYRSLEEAAQQLVQVKETFEPDPSAAERYHEHYLIYRDLYPALKELTHRIAAL
jgi:xylulokinase